MLKHLFRQTHNRDADFGTSASSDLPSTDYAQFVAEQLVSGIGNLGAGHQSSTHNTVITGGPTSVSASTTTTIATDTKQDKQRSSPDCPSPVFFDSRDQWRYSQDW
ncbi:hypothetical protein FGIG_10271 [Fasciola gigantica]|uniref:Uncharacterized protein n=1 Tax=Fasciola gigantica TaxID=46835 RepID=A0A504Y6D7_FASGI|nr:hypothetical protein FGIG_10271 [Fasciola gigantica]